MDTHGRAGGLSLLWDKAASMNILSCSSHHIDTIIKWDGDDVEWRFSGIYGWSEAQHNWKMGHLTCDHILLFLG